MKAMKTLLATGATLAFMAPAAHATFDSVGASHTKAKAVKAVKVKKTHKAASHKIVTASKGSGTTSSTSGGDGPLYIIWTSPLGSQSPVVDNSCESDGNDCTPAELCSYWGENCDQVDASQPADDQSMQNQNPAG